VRAQILAVKLDHVEGAEYRSVVITPGMEQLKYRESGFVCDDYLNAEIRGKRLLKSLPLRV